jgi:hypothetical protein
VGGLFLSGCFLAATGELMQRLAKSKTQKHPPSNLLRKFKRWGLRSLSLAPQNRPSFDFAQGMLFYSRFLRERGRKVFGEFWVGAKFAKHEKPNRTLALPLSERPSERCSEAERQRGETVHTSQTQPAQAGGASRKTIPPTQPEKP